MYISIKYVNSVILLALWFSSSIFHVSIFAQELNSSGEKPEKSYNTQSNVFYLIYSSKKHLENNHLDSAEFFIDKAGVLLKNKPWPAQYSEQLFNVTRNLYNSSFYSKTISKTKRLIDNYKKHNSEYYMFHCLNMNASSHMFLGDFEAADFGYDKYLNYIEKLDKNEYSKDELIDIRTSYYFGKGISHGIQGDYVESLLWFEKGDSILQFGGSKHNKLKMLTYMGNINYALSNYESAINYYKEVEKAYLQGEKVDMLAVYDNMASCYVFINHFDEAEKYLKLNLTLARSIGDSITIGYNYLVQAQIDEVKKNYPKALDNLLIALNLFEFVEDQVMVASTKLRIVTLANNGGLSEKKHLKMIDDVITFYRTTNIKEKELVAYKHKAKLLYYLGDYKSSFEMFSFHDSIKHAWTVEIYNEKTAELESTYKANYYKLESENQAKYAELLEQKNKRSSILIYAISTVLILFVFVVILFWMLNYKLRESRKKVAEQNATLEKRSLEKSLLLKELHHRVKNNLQIVSSLLNLQSISVKDVSAQNAFKDGQNRVDAMAMIHKYLYTSDDLTHVDIQSYLKRLVESIAYSYNFSKKNINYKFDISPESIDVDIAIPLGLIANELVSNAFKHAFLNMENPELSLVLNVDDKLFFQVKDNGQGVPETIESKDSFGLELVHSLIAQLNARLEYTFDNGACFGISIPLDMFNKPVI